jgi:pre-mRNA-processing factor SLU7
MDRQGDQSQNPDYITKVPWYLDNGENNVKHQNAWQSKTVSDGWYKRGTKGDIKKTWEKGSCKNCGARTHQEKECLERPRKVKACINQKNLKSDDHLETLDFNYVTKRDQWNGYDGSTFIRQIHEFERQETVRKEVRANKKAAAKRKAQELGEDLPESASESEDEDRIGDFQDSNIQSNSKSSVTKTSSRNLRMREDIAKYLVNIHSESFYDPITRSMRADPMTDAQRKELEEKTDDVHIQAMAFRGENWVKQTGDTGHFTEQNVFCWNQYKTKVAGADDVGTCSTKSKIVHAAVLPTQASKLHQEYKKRMAEKPTIDQATLDAYGGSQRLVQESEAEKKERLIASCSHYKEYQPPSKKDKLDN